MYAAIQSEKCFEAGNNASAIAIMKSMPQDIGLLVPSDAFLNPGTGVPNASLDFPSYPVFVDPLGVRAFGVVQLAAPYPSCIARRTVSFVNTSLDALQWFTLQDDIDFENAPPPNTGLSLPGTPRLIVPAVPPPFGTFSRDTRYSYAYLFQRPRYSDATVIDATVVVYNKRPVNLTALLSPPEYAYSGNTFFNVGNNTVMIDYTNNVPPPLRVGDWILDATPIPLGNANQTAHGYFYRVVGLNDLGNQAAGSLLVVEVEQSIRGFPPQGSFGTVIILDGVAEVYTKGTSR